MAGSVAESPPLDVDPVPAFAINHQITFRVRGGRRQCDQVAKFRDKVATRQLRVRNCVDLRVAVEVSPSRRGACKEFFQALSWFERTGIQKEQMVTCPRGLKLYTTSYVLIGEATRDGRRWNQEGCTAIGQQNLVAEPPPPDEMKD